MPKYGLATILEDHPVGYEFAGDNLPLHLTHVDSFRADLDPAEMEARLQGALAGQKAFEAKALKDELYGPNKDIPVTVLELTPELKALHAIIMDLLQIEGAFVKNPHFHREGFRPHVSIYEPRRVTVDEGILIRDISIVAKLSEEENAMRRILGTVSFKKEQQA